MKMAANRVLTFEAAPSHMLLADPILDHVRSTLLTAGLGIHNHVLFHNNEGTSMLFTWYYYITSHTRPSSIIARYINIYYKPYKLTERGGFFIEGIGRK
jgi:hypothetical protein